MSPSKKPHSRFDPYRNYTFRVKWDGRIVAGVRRVTALRRTVEVVEYRQGSDLGATQKLPGRVRYEPITLERGVTHDTTFETWASQVAGSAPALSFRKEVRLELYDSDGHLTVAYDIHRCWPSEYVALGGLDAGPDCSPFQSLTLENEGWKRDATVGRRPRRRRPKR